MVASGNIATAYSETSRRVCSVVLRFALCLFIPTRGLVLQLDTLSLFIPNIIKNGFCSRGRFRIRYARPAPSPAPSPSPLRPLTSNYRYLSSISFSRPSCISFPIPFPRIPLFTSTKPRLTRVCLQTPPNPSSNAQYRHKVKIPNPHNPGRCTHRSPLALWRRWHYSHCDRGPQFSCVCNVADNSQTHEFFPDPAATTAATTISTSTPSTLNARL